jgi:DNA-binding transcriptional ArsR family regulator
MPALLWDEGTAYDLFVSLNVLHRPSMFGVRAAWAAGVRSRLPAAQREYLEKVETFLPVPLNWLYLLPAEDKNAAGALTALAQLPAAERLPSLLFTTDTPIEVINILKGITLRQTWTSAEQEVLRAALLKRGIFPRPNTMNNLCEAWMHLTTSGDRFLKAMMTYYEVFFAEEELRIRPLLETARQQAEKLASTLTIPDLLEELSRGVHFEQAETAEKIILAPSYWSSPLVFYSWLPVEPPQANRNLLVIFGALPEAHDLTPGEALPQDLVDTMKAIADPTRLRILRYLAGGPLGPADLARRLRLRPPTVIHHLNALRLAGLVEIILHSEDERGYQLRREALNDALSLLIDFLTPEENI